MALAVLAAGCQRPHVLGACPDMVALAYWGGEQRLWDARAWCGLRVPPAVAWWAPDERSGVASGEGARAWGQGHSNGTRHGDGQRWDRDTKMGKSIWAGTQDRAQGHGHRGRTGYGDRDAEVGQGTGTEAEHGDTDGTGMGLTGLPIATRPPALLVGAGPGVGVVSHRFYQPVHDFIRSIVWGAGNVLLGWGTLGRAGVPCPCTGTTGMLASAVLSQPGMP